MLTVYYRHSGCDDFRQFRDKEEFEEWLGRQMIICPDTVIIKIVES